jgi:hypothetical protein
MFEWQPLENSIKTISEVVKWFQNKESIPCQFVNYCFLLPTSGFDRHIGGKSLSSIDLHISIKMAIFLELYTNVAREW